METLLRDIRYSLRTWLKSPGFTSVAVLTLALGIGGTTAVYSFVSGILLTPLPYADPEGLVVITRNNKAQGLEGLMMISRDVAAFREQTRSFAGLSGYTYGGVNLSGDPIPERVWSARILPNLLPLLGIEPALGRSFLPEEHEGGQTVVILSYGLWQRRFGGDDGVIGQTLRIDGEQNTIVGILPRGSELPPRSVDVLTPMSDAELQRESISLLWMLARLDSKVSLEVANEEANSILQRLEEENQPPVTGWRADVVPLRQELVGDVEPTLLVLLGAVALVLLIACANVANLLLARGAVREKELAIRAAVGAARRRITRQLLTESVLLSLTGGGIGVLLAMGGKELLLAFVPDGTPRLGDVALDARVLAFAVAISVTTGIISGIFPALAMSRLDLDRSLKTMSHVMTSTPSRLRFRTLLTVSQVALALTLTIGAGLMMRSFLRLVAVDPGFEDDGVLTMQLSFPQYRYSEPHRWTNTLEEILERVGRLPEVGSPAASTWTPMTGSYAQAQVSAEAGSGEVLEQERWPTVLGVTPGYFRSLGIPLLRGRDFTLEDRPQESGVVIVNKRLAERGWPDENAVGKRLKFGGPDSTYRWFTVVGVVGDARLIGLASEEQEGMFLPLLRTDRTHSSVQILVRTGSDPMSAVPLLRDLIWQVDHELPISDIRTMGQLISSNVAQPRFQLAIFSVFAWLAMALAGIGIYGVVSHSAALRSREIGLRMALGANRSAVIKLVMRHGAALVLVGLVVGLGLAFALTRLLTSFLYEVSATEATTFATSSVLLGVIGLAATFLPAWRAARLDPMSTLRAE